MCTDFTEGWCGHMRDKCVFLAHVGDGTWRHEYQPTGTMGSYKIGKKCQCGRSTWTEEMQDRSDAAWDKMTSDSNLNRM